MTKRNFTPPGTWSEIYEALERSIGLCGIAIYALRKAGDYKTADQLAEINEKNAATLAKAPGKL